MINAEDIERGTEADFEKILDALPLVDEITILQEGEPVAKFVSVDEYNRLMSLISSVEDK